MAGSHVAGELDVLSAMLLGLVQGVTEWLPVSSSAHLALAQMLLGVHPPIFFDLLLHVATLLVLLLYFRNDVRDIIRAVASTPRALRDSSWTEAWSDPHRRFAWFIVLGSIPTAIVALLLASQAEAFFDSPRAIGLGLLVTGTVLWLTRYAREPAPSALGWKAALAIGTAQGLAVLPGISRSGSTISTATFLGVDRETAVRYSFLLSAPAVAGAVILGWSPDAFASLAANPLSYGAGFAAAAAAGYFAVGILALLIRSRRFHWFAPYCWALGAGILLFVSA